MSESTSDKASLTDYKENYASKFTQYRNLKEQEVINYKNRFDNRLYLSYNIRDYNLFDFKNNPIYDDYSIAKYYCLFLVPNPNRTLYFRTLNWEELIQSGSHEITQYKRVYRLENYLLKNKNFHNYSIVFFFGITIFCICYYDQQRKYKVWLNGNYGDYVPRREKLFEYSFRYIIRSFRYELHRWRLIHFYFSGTRGEHNNYETSGGERTACYYDYICRLENYKRFRINKMDFLTPGEIGKDEYLKLNKYYLA